MIVKHNPIPAGGSGPAITDREVVADLARAKATFQLRSIVTAMGIDPSTVLFVSPPCQSWSRPTVTRLEAGSAEGGPGSWPDAGMGLGS